jgi:transcriptional regulator of arginine metabolism
MVRLKRLNDIREIISSKKINSQDELLRELRKKGYDVTQSTISRDLDYLRVVKIRNYLQEEYYTIDKGVYESKVFDPEKLKTRFRQSVISIKRAENIIVVKTFPGEAQGTAAIIDGMNFVEIMGTVAGDDTIICIIDSLKNAEKILGMMKTQF